MRVIHKNVVAIWVFAVSLVALLLNTTSIPIHGQSTIILTQKLGIDPLPSFISPVYGWVVKAIAVVTGSNVIGAVNIFSAVCGAIVLALVFMFVYRLARIHNVEKNFAPPEMHRIQLFSGFIAVLYLLASAPFMMAATRANPMMFDLVLLLFPIYISLSATKTNYATRLPLAALIYGIAIVEFSTAILLSPIFAVLVLAKLWTVNALNLKQVGKVFGAGFLGLWVYFIQAGLYTSSEAFVWREFSSFFEVLWYIWVEQKNELTKTLPRVGWLTLGLVSFLPWIITSFMRLSRKTANNSGATFGICALNLMLGVLAVLLLIDGFPLAPMSLTGTARLFVTPYLMIAMWVGSVAAFWLVILFREKRFENAFLSKTRRVIGFVVLASAPIYLFTVVLVKSMPATSSKEDALAYAFTRHLVDVVQDKEWLVTSTPLDDQIALECYKQDLPLKMIRLSHGRSVAYMRYVARMFDDRPRLQSLAGVGIAPFMERWFAEDPNVDSSVAVVHVPDVWLVAGMEALPNQLVFTGAKAGSNIDVEGLLAANKKFWEGLGSQVIQVVSEEDIGPVTAWMSTHLSKVANNLGVFLEDKGFSDEAYDCYLKAREFAPESLSALMNLHVLSGRKEMPEHAEYEQELVERTEKLIGKVQTWTLSYVYGFVRVPELFMNRGMAFAMSGKANMAITDMKRALQLKEGSPEAQMVLAELYFSQEKDEESGKYYRNVLEANPNNTAARLGLMRIAIRQKKTAEAREHLSKLKELKYNSEALKLEEAVLEAFDGAPTKSMKLLREVVDKNPNHMQAWAAIAIAAAQLKDARAGEEAIERLRGANMLSPNIQIVMAQSALDQKDRDSARRHLGEILRKKPRNIRALEMLLRINMSEGNEDAVHDVAEKILAVDPSNALGNYMLGVHHYYNEEYALAESAYRASLATRRAPETLNDLAYVLYLQGNYEEAEVLVRETLEINEGNSSAWDTLGVILMEQGDLKGAEEALVRSLGLRAKASTVMLSLAMLYERQERWADARELVSGISAQINELPPTDQNRLSALQQRLDDRR